jgi:23S rRNA-/tRNA-specific pseudouridylate synthase
VSILCCESDDVEGRWRKVSDPSYRLEEGSKVSVYGQAFAGSETFAEPIDGKQRLEPTKSELSKLRSSVLFSDQNLMVINKPAGKFSVATFLMENPKVSSHILD